MIHTFNYHPNVKHDALNVKPYIINLKDIDHENSYLEFVRMLNENLGSKSELIIVNVDSYGGSVYSALGIVDAIKNCPVPIVTVCQTKAMSAGALIFISGLRRYIAPLASLMFHDVSSFIVGKNSEIQADAKETERLNNNIWEIVKLRSNLSNDTLAEKLSNIKHSDWYLTATECLELDMADVVGIPALRTEVTVKTELVI